jgi:hypothetical protein
MVSCGERTLRTSYLDPVRFAEPDDLADDGIGAVRRCEYGSHSLATGMDTARDGDREWPSEPVRARMICCGKRYLR